MNQSTIKRRILLFLMLLLATNGIAQNVKISNPIPPSPTAASLGLYGDIPVSNYTGIPSVSLPLYEVDAKGFRIPISLNYHASGVRVEEEASWVGLGWSLSAGGVITRSVRGGDDLPTQGGLIGFPDSPTPEVNEDNQYYGSENSADLALALGVLNKQYDTEPDFFYFNFLGYSGKFVIKRRLSQSSPLEIQVISQEKITINVNRNFQTNEYEWIITTADGNRFLFKTVEKTKTYTQTFPNIDSQNDPIDDSPSLIATSWYLTEIHTNKGEIIHFTYTEPSINGSRRSILKSEMYSHYLYSVDLFPFIDCGPKECAPNSHYYTSSLQVNYDIYLKEISYRNISIQFTTSAREDMAPFNDPYVVNTLPQKLDRITINAVKNGQREVFKFFDLNSQYFNSGSGFGAVSKRLKLVSVTEKTPTESKPPHIFNYHKFNNIEIADKNSKAKDHWGYFNGKDNNHILSMGLSKSTTIPRIKITNPNTGAITYANGANRETDPNYVNIGVLSKITYPTGGFSEFEYEPHDYYQEGRVTIPKLATLMKSGELITNPDGPDVTNYTLNLSGSTLINFFVSSTNTSSACNVITTDRIVASIINTATNVPIHIYLNTGCNKDDRVNYINELPAGTYNVVVYATAYFVTHANLTWEEETNDPILSKIGGGLRIKNIKTKESIGGLEKNIGYKYTTNDGMNDISSGRLMTPLIYDYNWFVYYTRGCQIFEVGYPDDYKCFYNYSESSPNIPLGSSASGSAVGYLEVSVETSDGISLSGGKTVYKYLNSPDVFYERYLPTIPNLSNGFLTHQEDYKKDEQGIYHKISQLDVEYQQEETARIRMTGMKVFLPQGFPLHLINYYEVLKFYSVFSEWWHKSKEIKVEYPYGPSLQASGVETNFFYENPEHKFATKTVTTQSDGSKITTKYLRPADYPNANNLVLDEMRGYAHMHDRIIEEIVEIEKDEQTKTKSAIYTKYDFGDIGIVPKSVSKLMVKQPKLGFANSLSNGFSNDQDYQIIQNATYDPWSGNVVEIVENNQKYTTFIWGYGHLYPIAKIENAKRSEIENVINAQDLAFFGDEYPTDVEVNTFLVPLRSSTLLKDALITTYTYKPLVGISSITDPKNTTTYYGYDGFGRLILLKDHYGNIVKSYCYNYAGQQTDCSVPLPQVYTNSVQNQSFTKNNCLTGETGSSVIYTVVAGKYSSTVSQAAADALAMADISANGQAYANSNGTCTPIQTCKTYKITIPVAVSSNLYLGFTRCGASTYTLNALNAMDVEMTDENDSMIVYLSIEGNSSSIQFQYGPTGSAQVIGSIVIEEI